MYINTLRKRRAALGLSQEELARLAGVSSRSIMRHEKGRAQSPAVRRLLETELARLERKNK